MDNFNCKQHLKCGEWEKKPNPFAISKGSIAHETKQKCHRKYAIERKKPIVMKNSGGTKPMTIHRICNY